MSIEQTAASTAPYVRSILRIVVALLFLDHGLSRLFGWPSPLPTPHVLTMYWFAGMIELCGSCLVLLGPFTRPAAFIMSGETRRAGSFRSSTTATARFCIALSSCISPSPAPARGAWTRCGGRRPKKPGAG